MYYDFNALNFKSDDEKDFYQQFIGTTNIWLSGSLQTGENDMNIYNYFPNKNKQEIYELFRDNYYFFSVQPEKVMEWDNVNFFDKFYQLLTNFN